MHVILISEYRKLQLQIERYSETNLREPDMSRKKKPHDINPKPTQTTSLQESTNIDRKYDRLRAKSIRLSLDTCTQRSGVRYTALE